MPEEYSEYPPSRVQCHTYTATPAKGMPPLARSRMASSRVMGTPSAVPLISPKLDRMSLRTMPLSVSTSGPLEPSPGYGPAVSSGISPEAVVVPEDDEDAADDDELAELLEPPPQAASPTVAAPMPNTCRTRRRLSSVPPSKASPWSTTSSSGRGRGRPS